jgi:hypothetical protein
MNNQTRTRRRRFGAICIALAIGMLIAGETVLKTKLSGVALLCYWLACFVLTALAAGAAIIDAARVRSQLREQQRSLIEETLQQVEREKRSRKDPKE